jgi:S1-C subfamily serine protease
MFEQMASAAAAMGRPKPAMTTAITDLRLRLAGGSEVPARIVGRDRAQDLMFVRPASPPSSPLASVAEAAAGQPQIFDLVVSLRRFGAVLGWQIGASLGHVRALGDKGRSLYVISTATGDSAIGEPVFDLSGRFVGIVTLRTTGDVSGGPESLLQAVVVSAADVRDLAKRAK